MGKFNKFLAIAALCTLIILISGCVDQNEMTRKLVRQPEASAFLEEFPRAKVTSALLTTESIDIIIKELEKDCGQDFPVKDYWYLMMAEGGNKIEIYTNAETMEIECVVRQEANKPSNTCGPRDTRCLDKCDSGNDPDCFAKGKTTLREEEKLTGINGAGEYQGQKLYIKLHSVAEKASGLGYEAEFGLYDKDNSLIESKSVSQGTELNKTFLVGSAYAVLDSVKVTKIAVGEKSGNAYVELELAKTPTAPGPVTPPPAEECKDNDGICPSTCNPNQDSDCLEGKTVLKEGETLLGLRGMGEYEGRDNLFLKLEAVIYGSTNPTAKFALYDSKSKLIDQKTVLGKTALATEFSKDGQRVLLDSILVERIVFDTISSNSFVELETLAECINLDSKCPTNCDAGNDTDCIMPGKNILREGNSIEGLKGSGKYLGLSSLELKLVKVTAIRDGLDYLGQFDLFYNNELLDTQFASTAAVISDKFLDGDGERILWDKITVSRVEIGERSEKGHAEISLEPMATFGLLFEGETMPNLNGIGTYLGQKLNLRVDNVRKSGSYYRADLSILDSSGNTIDSKEFSKSERLEEEFEENSQKVLLDKLIVEEINQAEISKKGYVKLKQG